MKNKKGLTLLLGLALMLTVVACGNKETGKKNDDKKTQETVQSEAENDAEEDVKEDTEKEAENTGDATQVETPENSENNNTQSVEPTFEKVTMYAKSSVNVRSGAGTSNTKVGSLTKGQEVAKVGEENGWSKIEFNGTVGYVSSKYLSTEKVSVSTANSSTGNSNGNTNNNTNTENTTPSTPTHEHDWQPVKLREYQVIKNYVNGCNGCGYPLFTISENGAQHIENLYFHPACYSERLGGDCTGGGFHSESYTSGYCGLCGGKVSYRQCMWTENGKRCIKNEAAGPYEKVEFDQNYFMYFDACDCGHNSIIVGDAGGIVYGNDVCSICGATKKPYE